MKTWQRDEDFAERRDDWSDDEDEDEDSWQMRRVMLDPKVREQVELMTGKTCRRLARTGGLTEPAKGLMALEKLEKLNYSLVRRTGFNDPPPVAPPFIRCLFSLTFGAWQPDRA